MLGSWRDSSDLREGRNFRCFGQDSFEQPQKIAHLLARNDKWRQQANGEIVRAVDEQAMLQSGSDERRAIDGKFYAEDQALATDFADKVEFCGQRLEAFAKFRAALANIREEFGVVDDLQKLQRSGADQR